MHVKTFATFGIAFALVAVACSSSSSDNNGDGSSVDQDAGDQTDDASTGTDASTGVTTREGDDCTATAKCSTGQECITISHHGGQAICMNSCAGKNKCPGDETCDNNICSPTCSGKGCPSAMECITDIDECIFDCDHNPKLCGPGEACLQSIECGPPVVDAGPTVCKSGGGTATSGITGNKEVGLLTATEQGTFCDWAAAVTGGYGCDGECDGGLDVTFSANQADCISKFTKSGCTATVTDVETCVKTNAQNVCSLAVLNSPDCASLRACL